MRADERRRLELVRLPRRCRISTRSWRSVTSSWHAYAVEFDPVRLDTLAAEVALVHQGVAADLRRFADHLQRTAGGLQG